ncbi:MAG TPA: DUF434 domain-containing protein [Tepidisphaeraceae bacterium]|jgi:hypothetical protein|nr:DUF434 domain-containing protein [Tepidisphaeraceae bacterium]
MPDSRRHRGPHPEDHRLFHADRVGDLRAAVADFSLLLTRGYATPSALKLVGDRFNLTERQRTAIQRASCSDQAMVNRGKSEVPWQAMLDEPLLIDGYNILTTLETALSGGPVFACRDGCFRDMASIHGTYRKVEETIPALNLLAEFLNPANSGPVTILLDSPVSNSGRLKTAIVDADSHWQVELVPNPDPILAASEQIIVTADSIILDEAKRWLNLARHIITLRVPDAWIVELNPPPIALD